MQRQHRSHQTSRDDERLQRQSTSDGDALREQHLLKAETERAQEHALRDRVNRRADHRGLRISHHHEEQNQRDHHRGNRADPQDRRVVLDQRVTHCARANREDGAEAGLGHHTLH